MEQSSRHQLSPFCSTQRSANLFSTISLGISLGKRLREENLWVYGHFWDRGEWRIQWHQELYHIYDDMDELKRIKIQRLRWLGCIAPSQFIKSSNLNQVVEVTKERVRLNSWMRM